jgi:hypothetical protein
MTSALKPNPQFDHAFAIVRVDVFQRLDVAVDQLPSRITVKKVVWDAETAREEVERLNLLNKDKDCIYFSQVTRIERKQQQPS